MRVSQGIRERVGCLRSCYIHPTVPQRMGEHRTCAPRHPQDALLDRTYLIGTNLPNWGFTLSNLVLHRSVWKLGSRSGNKKNYYHTDHGVSLAHVPPPPYHLTTTTTKVRPSRFIFGFGGLCIIRRTPMGFIYRFRAVHGRHVVRAYRLSGSTSSYRGR